MRDGRISQTVNKPGKTWEKYLGWVVYRGENKNKGRDGLRRAGEQAWENGEKTTYERDHPCGSTAGQQTCWLPDHKIIES